jgi:nucleotidyltransferase substrate binding protein (TIGR01987 family)
MAAAEEPDVRWKQRFHSFRGALSRLRQAARLSAQRTLSELEQQGVIKAFEFTHELAWNTLKDYLENQGETQLRGSKDTTRKAFQRDLILDGEVWMEMIESRNRSSHIYSEEMAARICQQAMKEYLPAFEQMEKVFLQEKFA